MNIERVFCWLPTKVWSSPFYRDGCVWFGFAYLGRFGRLYRTRNQASGDTP